MSELVTLAVARLISQANSPSLDGDTLRRELQSVKSVFPDAADTLHSEVARALERNATSRAADDPYGARAYVASALVVVPESRALTALSAQLPPREIARVRDHMDAGRLSAAQKSLRTARARYPRHDDIARLATELDTRMADARRAYESYALGVKKRELTRASQRRAAYAGVKRLWSDNPELRPVKYREPRPGECAEELAGRGRESAGICYDLIAGAAPAMPMVVVPGGDDIDKAYAIGKYETSVAEFNTFCRQSGECMSASSRTRSPDAGHRDPPGDRRALCPLVIRAGQLEQRRPRRLPPANGQRMATRCRGRRCPRHQGY